jgi:hypothetical protein
LWVKGDMVMKNGHNKTIEDWLFYIGNILLLILVVGWPIFLHFANRLTLGCVFQRLTGYQCLACGGTRAFNAMLHGQFLTSLKYNPIVLYFFAMFGWFMISWYIQKLSRGKFKIGMRFRVWYVYVGLAILVLQCTVKNVYIFLYLR